MTGQQYKKEINKAIESFCRAWTDMDFGTFDNTVSWFAYDPLIADSWTKRMQQMIGDLDKTRLSKKEIAGLFPNMSELRVKMGFDMWMAKYAKVSQDERVTIAKFYVDLLTAYCLEDPYAFKKNIVHSHQEVQNFLKQVKPASTQIAKKLGRLVSACYHLGHAAYSDMYPSIVYENYGPYNLGKGCILAIKNFDNLRCPELWPETKNLPWMQVSIINVYQKVKMRVDSASHGIYEGDLVKNLKQFSLRIDGKIFPIKKVDKVSETLEKFAINLFRKYQLLDQEKKKTKYYYQKAYVYKKIYDYLGQAWHPSPEILKEAKGKPLYKTAWPKRKKEKMVLFRKIFDPYQGFPKNLTR